MKARCPKCQQDVTGSLEECMRHVDSCGLKKTKKTKIRPDEAYGDCRPNMPVLPLALTCERATQSQNAYKSKHFWFYTNDAKGWLNYLRPIAIDLNILGLGLVWSSWRITRIFGGRQRAFDYGNLVGGCKPLPDALINLGIIVDDDPAHFTCAYEQREADGNIKTIIELLEGRQ